MAEAVSVTDKYGTYYYIDSSSSRDVLSWAQMCSNALYFYTYAHTFYPTWTKESISAMLGNIRYEGIMNPSQWQYGLNKSETGGYGLVQWTPATKFLNWLSPAQSRTAIAPQVQRIGYENANNIQWIKTKNYPLSFSEFLNSNLEPEYLASVWLYNYERPARPHETESYRKSMARTWYDYLGGGDPEPPGPTPDPPEPPGPIAHSRNMSIALYHNRKRR